MHCSCNNYLDTELTPTLVCIITSNWVARVRLNVVHIFIMNKTFFVCYIFWCKIKTVFYSPATLGSATTGGPFGGLNIGELLSNPNIMNLV